MKEWYCARELAGLAGLPKNPQDISRKAQREGWPSRDHAGQGGGKEYPLSALPAKTQTALAVKHAESISLPVSDKAAPSSSASDARAEARAAIFEAKPEKSKQRARAGLVIVQEYQRLIASGYKKKDARAAVSLKHQICESTVRNLWREVKNEPPHRWLYHLVDQHPGRAKREISAEAREALMADFLRLERPTKEACISRLQRGAREHGWKLPSKYTLKRRLDEIPRIVQVIKREGPTAAKQIYPAQQRLKHALTALEIVNGDGYKHNVWVRFPDGEVRRPQTWIFQDVYSGKILTWRIDKTENTEVFRLAFGDLVESYGIPEAVVIDNTHAAANKTMTGGARHRYRFKVREEEPLGILELFGIKYCPTTPRWGQGKPVERTLGIGGIGEYVDKAPELTGAWTGANPLDKPEYDGKHRAIDLADFEQVVAREIAAWNAREGRRGAIQQGRSCDAVFDESYSRAAIRRATEAQRRLWLLATEPVLASSRNGEITLGAGRIAGERVANRYWSVEMADLAGRQVVARFDPQRLHQGVHIYTLDGRYVCFAECVKPAAFNDANAAREHNRARNTFLRAGRQMADAETRMSTLDAAKAYVGGGPSTIPPPRAPRSNVVRGEFRDPLERPLREAAADTPEEAAENAAFAREMAELPTVKRDRDIDRDAPLFNLQRCDTLDACILAGELVSDEDRAWHASYKGSRARQSDVDYVEDFPTLREARMKTAGQR